MSARRDQLGRRFARFVTDRVVAHPMLWRVFRRPLRRQFDGLAPVWDARRGTDALMPLGAALDALAEAPRRILDLGTGTGTGARVLARRFREAEVVGVDLSDRMVAEARRLLPDDLAGRLRFEQADASALKFEDGEFDLVVLLNMIPFFDELARVTAPGGAVVFAFSSGPQTPIFVPTETLRARLGLLGFDAISELAAGEGSAVIARRAGSPQTAQTA